jgi:hypothetical protein
MKLAKAALFSSDVQLDDALLVENIVSFQERKGITT